VIDTAAAAGEKPQPAAGSKVAALHKAPAPAKATVKPKLTVAVMAAPAPAKATAKKPTVAVKAAPAPVKAVAAPAKPTARPIVAVKAAPAPAKAVAKPIVAVKAAPAPAKPTTKPKPKKAPVVPAATPEASEEAAAAVEDLLSHGREDGFITHDQILELVWGTEYSGETELVRSFIRNLRHKLGDDARQPRYILTEPRVGYRMPRPPA